MKNPEFFARLSAAYKDRAEPENLRLLARESWRVLVVCAALLILAACAFGFWELMSASEMINGAQTQNTSGNGNDLDRSQLDSAMQALQTRSSTFQSLVASPTSPVADPYTD